MKIKEWLGELFYYLTIFFHYFIVYLAVTAIILIFSPVLFIAGGVEAIINAYKGKQFPFEKKRLKL